MPRRYMNKLFVRSLVARIVLRNRHRAAERICGEAHRFDPPGLPLTISLCSATGTFAICSNRIKNITTRLARTYHCTRTRRFRAPSRPLVVWTASLWQRDPKRREWTKHDVRELKSSARQRTPAAKFAKSLKRTLSATRQKAFVLAWRVIGFARVGRCHQAQWASVSLG
jgi:hypothetical protein